ncbi:MAG TPA: MFS transporter [Candidatus Fimenecus excrementigallinarum]|uniref:MFS transporter n=1 Tax=Candidatus Fimenecus excrementigallinarum TaxID=2840816 RepID=A0A9D1IEU4_9FIRM|nr:MFS transporter [Candidatus Fimenecus excrementigallinarum]
MAEKTEKLGGRIWFNIILFGLVGQLAWAVENMFFNTFLYNSIYKGATQSAVDGSIDVMSAINLMVAASAATAVVATFLAGTLSDKLGRRKAFICAGYILWGLVTASFGAISRDNTAALFGLTDEVRILTVTVSIVIVMDCVMTVMGSVGNDAAFNSWVTDVSSARNRATVESVLSLLPIFGTVAIMGLSGAVGGIGYDLFFYILGGLVLLCGVVGLFTLRDKAQMVKTQGNYFQNLIYGFRPRVIRENKRLYLAFCAACISSTAFQVFFPYIFIYLGNVLNFSLDSVLASLTPGLLAAAAAAIVAVVVLLVCMGRLMDRFGKEKFVWISILLYAAGLVAAGFAKSAAVLLVCAVPALGGWALLSIAVNASVRDFMPADKVGAFQGIRMLFFVLVPMVVGPYIGNLVCRVSEVTYTNEYGVVTSAPGNVMFYAAAAVAVFVFVPILFLRRYGGFAVKDRADGKE